ncbi:MAG: glycosyl hydrolase family 65 protein, partial [Saprospiraceae bacterium]
QSSSLYEHCVRAIDYGLRFGEHGLPLIGAGDWNDGMDRVGVEGKGESVWLGWFLYDTIKKFMEVVRIKNDGSRMTRLSDIAQTLKDNIEQHAWDGQWYRRAFFDDGTPLGSKTNKECKIDSIAQSWSVLSGAGDKTHAKEGMLEAEKRLVRPKEKIIQLFDPPFDKSKLDPGYIKGYVPGVRENGGQYTHAAIWMIMAFAGMRDKKRLYALLNMVNPINHGNTAESIAVYKVEPYVIAADVYAVSNHAGRGGWTWYTGSAGWMYQLMIEYVLGIKRRGDTLTFDPCIPDEWKEVKIKYRFKQTTYVIQINQDVSHEKTMFVFEGGKEVEKKIILLVDDGVGHEIEVRIRNSYAHGGS